MGRLFENEQMILKTTIETDEYRQKLRKKLHDFLEKNPEMDGYIRHIMNTNVKGILYFLLGVAATILVVEILLIGYSAAGGILL